MADISLAKFRSNVTDVARPNRFWVKINDPTNDSKAYGSDNNASLESWKAEHEFLAKTTQLPGRTIGNIELNWQGMKYNIAGDPTFEDITFTFINNYEWDLRQFFENWVEKMAQMETNERSQPNAYKSNTITMQQLGRTQADILKTYKLVGAYPTSVAAIDLSQDSMDTAEEISVTMKYDYFEVS
jgi:hypothetical protein